jgi:hypothetical protein
VVGNDSIIPPGREGKVTQEIKIAHAHSGVLRKYVTVISNAKNKPELKLSLGCTIRSELGVEPGYLSITPDKNGDIKQVLKLTTQKKDLKVLEVRFVEQQKSDGKGAAWQAALPLKFTFKLTKTDTTLADDYIAYQLEISLHLEENKTLYGNFTIVTNHPKKKEISLSGVILEKAK